MGCAGSKQKRCRHCNAPYSPVSRSYSMHVHHPPQNEGDSYHVVALTSTTLGSLKLDSPLPNHHLRRRFAENGKVSDSDSFRFGNGILKEDEKKSERKSKEFSMGLMEAKTWSSMLEQKLPKAIPKTPIRTPPGEPETINTWELMEGLEDISPFRSPHHFRSFSFDQPVSTPIDPPRSSMAQSPSVSPKPMWLQMTQDESDLKFASPITEFDPEVIASFRKSLQELTPDSPFHLRRIDGEKQQDTTKKDLSFGVSEEKKTHGDNMDLKPLPYKKHRVVLYFTSLRGVRKTYEDCCHVRLILKGVGVRVDERDVSMHSGFKEELKELLGQGFNGVGLPRVFVGRNYIGGAEEIQRLHEDGKLEKLLNCCENVDDDGGGDGNRVCEACGDIRFVPCETCSGSCKIYYEAGEEEEEEEEEEDEHGEAGDYGFQRCPDCNENGLVRCPICCY